MVAGEIHSRAWIPPSIQNAFLPASKSVDSCIKREKRDGVLTLRCQSVILVRVPGDPKVRGLVLGPGQLKNKTKLHVVKCCDSIASLQVTNDKDPAE